MAEIASLFGGPTGEHEVNDNCVQMLREWLEMAEAGEVIGVVMVGLCYDRLTRYGVAGRVGGYSMIGAIEVAKADLMAADSDG